MGAFVALDGLLASRRVWRGKPVALPASAPEPTPPGDTLVGGIDGLLRVPGVAQTPAGRTRTVRFL